MQLTCTFVALVAALSQLASASPVPFPSGAAGLPTGTTLLGFDPDAGVAQAYDNKGTLLGNVSTSSLPRRQSTSGTCAALDATQMQTIPGWSKLVAVAQQSWGSGSWKIQTNLPQYTGNPATVCVNDRSSANPPKIVTTGTPNCADSSQTTDGKFIGVAGTVSLTGNEGTTASSTTTVTKESSIGVDVSVSAEIDFPLVAKFTSTVTLTSSFKNTLATATQTGTNTMQGRTFTISPTAGQTCSLQYHAESCTVSGSGNMPWVASGWAWFVYDKKTQGHWYWALLMEAYLTDEADRTSNMEVSVAMSSTTNSNYSAVCVGGQSSSSVPILASASAKGALGSAGTASVSKPASSQSVKLPGSSSTARSASGTSARSSASAVSTGEPFAAPSKAPSTVQSASGAAALSSALSTINPFLAPATSSQAPSSAKPSSAPSRSSSGSGSASAKPSASLK